MGKNNQCYEKGRIAIILGSNKVAVTYTLHKLLEC